MKRRNNFALPQIFWGEAWPSALIRQLLWGIAGFCLLVFPMRSCFLIPYAGTTGAVLIGIKWIRFDRHSRQDCFTAAGVVVLLVLLFHAIRPDLRAAWSVVLLLLLAAEESRSVFQKGHSAVRWSALGILLLEAAAGILFLVVSWRGVYQLLCSWYALALLGVLLISCGRSWIQGGK